MRIFLKKIRDYFIRQSNYKILKKKVLSLSSSDSLDFYEYYTLMIQLDSYRRNGYIVNESYNKEKGCIRIKCYLEFNKSGRVRSEEF